MRDIEDYTKEYLKDGFEDYQVIYRRKKMLELLEKYPHKSILEIGCGKEPYFKFSDGFEKYMLIEPSDEFFENARKEASQDDRIKCVHDFFSVDRKWEWHTDFDFIICSSLLHEVERPEDIIKGVAEVSKDDTTIVANVPNAYSFHRVLAKYMGLIKDEYEMSERNTRFQQHSIFDMKSFSALFSCNGFQIIESGSFFIKPFTHEQMYKMLSSGIITENVLDGLYKMSDEFPEIGSEIYVVCRKTDLLN